MYCGCLRLQDCLFPPLRWRRPYIGRAMTFVGMVGVLWASLMGWERRVTVAMPTRRVRMPIRRRLLCMMLCDVFVDHWKGPIRLIGPNWWGSMRLLRLAVLTRSMVTEQGEGGGGEWSCHVGMGLLTPLLKSGLWEAWRLTVEESTPDGLRFSDFTKWSQHCT
jgi:hypothetical protein